MRWQPTELAHAAAIAARLENSPPRRTAIPPARHLTLTADDGEPLLEGLYLTRANFTAVAVRHLSQLLGFDELAPFKERLEHKLVQTHVLHHFCPDAVPATSGLFAYAHRLAGPLTPERLRAELRSGFVKRTLGYGSPPQNDDETSRAAYSFLSRGDMGAPTALTDERWIIQERLQPSAEYRVHTIEDSVIEDLTYVRHTFERLRCNQEGPNEYVASLLRRLPSAFFSNSICGWDIAELAPGEYRVLEVNFSGFHPCFGRGFQCSAFLQHDVWGPLAIARLVRHVERKYGITILYASAGQRSTPVTDIYLWIARWHQMLRLSDLVRTLETSLEWHSPIADAAMCSRYEPAEAVFIPLVKRFSKTCALIE